MWLENDPRPFAARPSLSPPWGQQVVGGGEYYTSRTGLCHRDSSWLVPHPWHVVRVKVRKGRAGCVRQGRGGGGGRWWKMEHNVAQWSEEEGLAGKWICPCPYAPFAHPACRLAQAVGEGAGDGRGECGRPLAAQARLLVSPSSSLFTVSGPARIKPGKPRVRCEGVGMWPPSVRARGGAAKCRKQLHSGPTCVCPQAPAHPRPSFGWGVSAAVVAWFSSHPLS